MWTTTRAARNCFSAIAVVAGLALLHVSCEDMSSNAYDDSRSWLITVEDESNQPVRGLRVRVVNNLQPEVSSDTVETMRTDGSGQCFFEYSAEDDTYQRRDSTFSISISHVDRTENGGEFQSKSVFLPRPEQDGTPTPVDVTMTAAAQ